MAIVNPEINNEEKAKVLISNAKDSIYLGRARDAKSFIGYLGLYPTQYQSGNSHTVGRLAKRGIPIAKHALYMSAVASVLHNEQLRKIFRDKVSSGKSKKDALIIISKK